MQESIRKRRSWRRLLTLFLALAMLAAYVPAAAATDETAEEPLAPDTDVVETEGAVDGTEEGITDADAIEEAGNEDEAGVDAGTGDDAEEAEETEASDGEEAGGEDAEDYADVEMAEEDPGIMPLDITSTHTFIAGNIPGVTKKTEYTAATNITTDDGYFTIQLSSKSKIDDSGKTWEDGYKSENSDYGYSKARVNFGATGNKSENSIKFTTTEEAANVTIWWVAGDDNRQICVMNGEGAPVRRSEYATTKDSTYISSFTLLGADTYYIGGLQSSSYIFKIEVGEGTLIREPWENVDPPVIKEAKQNEGEGKIKVSVTAEIGANYSDRVTVTMTGPGNNGRTASANSAKPGSSQSVEFTPTSSGRYTFTAEASRFNETETHKAVTEEPVTVDFILPLATPKVTVANAGGTSIKVDWDVVPEAKTYQVVVKDATSKEAVVTKTTERCVIAISEGLELNGKYTVEVTAFRDGEDDKSAAGTSSEITISGEKEIVWSKSSFGPSVAKTDSSQTANAEGTGRWGTLGSKAGPNTVGDIVKDGEVRVWATENSGKLQPADADGMMFVYTKIDPAEENFVLQATAHVNNWFYSNGQDGFGLMASDSIGTDGSSNSYYFNSYMALISNLQYFWNGSAVTDNAAAQHLNMRIGIGAQEKIGIDSQEIANDKIAAGSALNANATITTLENSCAVGLDPAVKSIEYNIIGNRIPGSDPTKEKVQKNLRYDLELVIGKNNSGYFVGYHDVEEYRTYPTTVPEKAEDKYAIVDGAMYVNGKWYTIVQYYNPNALSKLNSDAVYIGFFAARNADVTFQDINLDIHSWKDDPEPAGIVTSYVTPSFEIVSASISNTPDYRLAFYGNWGGQLVIKDQNGRQLSLMDSATGAPIADNHVNAEQKVYADVTLTGSENSFSWTMTPDKAEEGAPKRLIKETPVSGIHTVKYQTSGRDIIYVAPSTTKKPAGTRSDPMALADAVKIAAPGQTIVLLEGTYRLQSGLTIERGISGKPGKYINLMADTEAATRPIIDFCARGSGMVIAGDYWHLYGFDVTNSADGDKGIQVSGNNNILENLWTYRNGNTGIQIARYKSSDTNKDTDWPRDNLILNCSSFLNADGGYEDADGFAAKLTVGEGNVFDGCISAFNADDGWDLYAKGETGQIGKVTIQNCVAFFNGYDILNVQDPDDGSWEYKVITAGNGNGFKMGGQSLPGQHELYNSIAFGNKANGIDSNSCPDIHVYNSTTYNNINGNVSLRTEDWSYTQFIADGILSYKNADYPGFDWHALAMTADTVSPVGIQVFANLYAPTDYYFRGEVSANNAHAVTEAWFVEPEQALDMARVVGLDLNKIQSGNFFDYSNASGSAYNSNRIANGAIYRDENGRINMNGFLLLSDDADSAAGARLSAGVYKEIGETWDNRQAFPEVKGEAGGTSSAGSGGTGSAGGSVGGGGGGAAAPGGAAGGSGTTTPPPTTVNPEATVTGTTATSTVSESMSSQLLEKAESNNSASVVIEPDMPADVTKADVIIPGKTLSELGEKTNADVTVKTPAGEVTIPHKALEQLGGGENVTMSVETANGASTIQINVDGETVEKVDGGIKVAVPLEDGQVVVIVDENGNETILPKSIVEGGMAYAEISGSATIKVIDNNKSFNDVTSDSWFNDAIAFVSSHDLFGGVGEGNFDPNGEMNRAMLATVLWRLESKANADSTVAFPDVAAGEWYSDGIKWASANGIVKGMDDGTFAPNQAITRETMAVMLYRYAQAMGLDVSNSGSVDSFSDGESVSDWAKTEMAWAVGAGLLQGDANSLMPGASATRAQVATIIQRFVELIVK